MVFWSVVGLILLGLFAFSWWFDRKRRGAPSGRVDAEHQSAVARAHQQSWTSQQGDGSREM